MQKEERQRIALRLIYKRSSCSQNPSEARGSLQPGTGSNGRILTASPYESPTRQHRLRDWIHLHQVSSLDRCLQSKTSCEVHRPLLIALMGTVWFGVPGQDRVGLKLGRVETRVFKVSSPAPRLLGLGEGRAALSGFFPEKILCVCFPHVGEEKPPRSFLLLCYFCWKPKEMAEASPRLQFSSSARKQRKPARRVPQQGQPLRLLPGPG